MKEIVLVYRWIYRCLSQTYNLCLPQFARFGFPRGTFAVNFIDYTPLGICVELGLEKESSLALKEFTAIGILGDLPPFRPLV